MRRTSKKIFCAVVLVTGLAAASPAFAQSNAADSPWSIEFGLGWDNGISGNINSSGVGQINNQVVVVTRNSFDEVYGTGLHLRFGGGYMLNETTEIKGTFAFQSLDADFIVPMGDIGVSNLYGQYSDYQTLSLDFGLRRYAELKPKLLAYGEGTLGIGFVDKIDVGLVAPGANLATQNNDFYDQTSAFTVGINVGLLVQSGQNLRIFRAARPAFRDGDVRSRQPDGHWPGNHQRQELALDDAIRRGCAIPVLK